jgi:hypothetical protein
MRRNVSRLFCLFLLTIVLGIASTSAQNSCDDPFGGQRLSFDRGYWTKTDFCQRSIELTEIFSGGPPPNAIPPIGFPAYADLGMSELPGPQFETLEAARSWLQDQSPVIALEINGDARAYPLAILIWHEIVNDTVGETPVTVTFCPLCNSSLVFDRRVDGEELYFGTTGNLRNSDLVMWDDKTQSWWQQFTGEAIVGSYTGTTLTMLPSQVVGFGQFAAQYPQGQVLTRDTGTRRSYGENPYVFYDSGEPFLFSGAVDSRLASTERVLAGMIAGDAVAYPFSTLSEMVVINDSVGGEDVVAFWQGGVASALDRSQIDDSRDVGTAALYSRVLDGQTLTFTADESGVIRDDQTGSAWNAFGTATDGELAGQRLQQLLAAPHFWFAWAAFRPETRVYGVE